MTEVVMTEVPQKAKTKKKRSADEITEQNRLRVERHRQKIKETNPEKWKEVQKRDAELKQEDKVKRRVNISTQIECNRLMRENYNCQTASCEIKV